MLAVYLGDPRADRLESIGVRGSSTSTATILET
jgi:hypothetical protein